MGDGQDDKSQSKSTNDVKMSPLRQTTHTYNLNKLKIVILKLCYDGASIINVKRTWFTPPVTWPTQLLVELPQVSDPVTFNQSCLHEDPHAKNLHYTFIPNDHKFKTVGTKQKVYSPKP